MTHDTCRLDHSVGSNDMKGDKDENLSKQGKQKGTQSRLQSFACGRSYNDSRDRH